MTRVLLFVAAAKDIVSLLDLHEVETGALVAVAHPYEEYSNIHVLLGDEVPPASQALNADAVAYAEPLEEWRAPTKFHRRGWVLVLAFVVGAVGAPFLSTSDPVPCLKYMVGKYDGRVQQIDDGYLFEEVPLLEALDVLEGELGHDQVIEVAFADIKLDADASTALGGAQIEDVVVRGGKVISRTVKIREPGLDFNEAAFSLGTNWSQIIRAIPEAKNVARELGLADPKIERVSVARLLPISVALEVRMVFRDETGSETVFRGRLNVESFREEGGRSETVEVTHSDGRVARIAPADPTKVDSGRRFTINDVDWEATFAMIAEGQPIMAEAGAEGTEPTHIIIERDDTDVPYFRVYLKNEYDEGGYLEVEANGSIVRTMLP